LAVWVSVVWCLGRRCDVLLPAPGILVGRLIGDVFAVFAVVV